MSSNHAVHGESIENQTISMKDDNKKVDTKSMTDVDHYHQLLMKTKESSSQLYYPNLHEIRNSFLNENSSAYYVNDVFTDQDLDVINHFKAEFLLNKLWQTLPTPSDKSFSLLSLSAILKDLSLIVKHLHGGRIKSFSKYNYQFPTYSMSEVLLELTGRAAILDKKMCSKLAEELENATSKEMVANPNDWFYKAKLDSDNNSIFIP